MSNKRATIILPRRARTYANLRRAKIISPRRARTYAKLRRIKMNLTQKDQDLYEPKG